MLLKILSPCTGNPMIFDVVDSTPASEVYPDQRLVAAFFSEEGWCEYDPEAKEKFVPPSAEKVVQYDTLPLSHP